MFYTRYPFPVLGWPHSDGNRRLRPISVERAANQSQSNAVARRIPVRAEVEPLVGPEPGAAAAEVAESGVMDTIDREPLRPKPKASRPEATETVKVLQAELEKAGAAEARLLAEFKNYRRHAEADLAAARQRAEVELLSELADVVQALEVAQSSTEQDPDAVREGVSLVARQLQKVFDTHGLSRIETEGNPFDPRLHEAVLTEQAHGVDKGTIVREVSPGFVCGDKVIRPAKVSVAG